jgi:hypothetical protein
LRDDEKKKNPLKETIEQDPLDQNGIISFKCGKKHPKKEENSTSAGGVPEEVELKLGLKGSSPLPQ